jgi:ATP-dependent Clp protease ATP-binding subunit ClpC
VSDLTPGATIAWEIAALEAVGGGHEQIQRAHLAIGILSLEKLRDGPERGRALPPHVLAAAREEARQVGEILGQVGVSASELRRRLRRGLGTGDAPRTREKVSRSDAAKAAFVQADRLSGGGFVTAVHLLAALAKEPDPVLEGALERLRVEASALAEAAVAGTGVRAEGAAQPAEEARRERSSTPELDRFTRDLTRLAAAGEIGPIIGRRAVLLEVEQTLARSSKNNPLLLGEAGVGKTAIAEALAIRGAQGKDAAVLGGKRIVELSAGMLLSGTEYRGQLEERVSRIIEELKAHPEVIVFIDEIHTLVGAGRVSGGNLDIANMLKPALARGELRCIGATTLAEYRRYIEPDAALARRFVAIDVPEPTRDEALEILRGLRARWEEHHGVRIADAALAAAVDLSLRFDPERRLPDKAVDLVDLASARTRVPMLSTGLDHIAEDGATKAAAGTVTDLTIAEVLAEKRGLPLELVRSGGAGGARLLELPRFLRGRLVGQDDAIARVSRRIQVAHSDLKSRDGALAVFLFLGPTGVGKTEMARLLAEFLFGSRSDLVRLDMSEYMEEHSVAKLIGAPPGYVGHEEEGQLTSKLRTRPYSVVLLDEVEKAHPRVFDLCLQLFGDGRLTDAKGRVADARQAVFVMTSNLGSGPAREPMGFAGVQEPVPASPAALDEARRFFRPELLNRVDEIVVFRPLDREAVRGIVRPILAEIASSLRQKHHAELEVSPEAEVFLAEEGYSAANGARELQRTVDRLVGTPLSGLVLSGRLARHPHWRLVRTASGLDVRPV